MSLLRDEKGGYSMARTLLLTWTVFAMSVIVWKIDHLSQPLLTFLSSVYLFLASWAAGPRMAQYIAPQIAAAANAIGQSKSVELSTDIAEIKAKLQSQTNQKG
jgi:hypothetical protein